MNNKANIRRGTVNVYLGAANANPDNPGEWSHIGYCEGRQTSLKTDTVMFKCNGFQRGLGRFFEFTAANLQTTAADRATLESFDNQTISIMLSGISTPGEKLVLKNYYFTWHPEYVFEDTRAFKNVIRATAMTKKMFRAISVIDPPSDELISLEDYAIWQG